jgi:hypothetical protein
MLRETSHSPPVLTPELYVKPIVEMQRVASGDHFVQFYNHDQYLVQSVGAFAADGLALGDSCVFVATPAHRLAFANKLGAAGITVDECRQTGLYTEFDAAKILSQFMVNGYVDHRRARAGIEPLIQKAAQYTTGNVRIYGEMVALLWSDGNKEAAIELENFWNELAEVYSFTLMCGYPISGFGPDETDELRHVCRSHSHVFPHETNCDEFPGSRS